MYPLDNFTSFSLNWIYLCNHTGTDSVLPLAGDQWEQNCLGAFLSCACQQMFRPIHLVLLAVELTVLKALYDIIIHTICIVHWEQSWPQKVDYTVVLAARYYGRSSIRVTQSPSRDEETETRHPPPSQWKCYYVAAAAFALRKCDLGAVRMYTGGDWWRTKVVESV